MTSREVRERIEQEIGNRRDRSNVYGINLTKCLVDPRRQEFLGGGKKHPNLDLWVVLEEDPETGKGYKVVFDEQRGTYGLAVGTTFIGDHGSFLSALEAM